MYEYNGTSDVQDPSFRKAQQLCQRAKNKKHKERVKYSGGPTILFGLEVPCNVREALELDRKNGNHRWAEAIHKEMKGLQDHKTFAFLNPGEAAPTGYQFAPLRMIFTVKQDLRCKARLVIGGHVIDSIVSIQAKALWLR